MLGYSQLVIVLKHLIGEATDLAAGHRWDVGVVA